MDAVLKPKHQICIRIDPDAFVALEEVAGERGKGDFISRLILDAYQQKALVAPHIAEQLRALAAKLEGA